MRFLALACGLSVIRFHTFGNLIPEEMERSIKRYLPKMLQPFGVLIKPVIRVSFWLMNWMKIGLEQEVYLEKVRPGSEIVR